jgi:hypothetical protein
MDDRRVRTTVEDEMRHHVGILFVILAVSGGACSAERQAAPSPAAPETTADAAPATEPRRAPSVLDVPVAPGRAATTGTPQPTLLRWDPPATWVTTKPASQMRLAQYRVPGAGGDAECVVFYFGPGQGGDPMSNAVRWAGQFRQPDGQPSVDRMTTTKLDDTTLPIHVVEVSGIYDGGMTMTDAPATELAGHMLLGGIVEAPDAPWFFKLTGPEVTVRAQRDAFVTMLRSAHLDGE